MPTRTDTRNQLTVASHLAVSRLTDATVTAGTAFDTSSYAAGARFLLVLTAFQTNVANTGGAWTVTESATSGGSYTTATTGGTLTVPATTPGTTVRTVDVTPNPLKPWVKATFTGTDATTEVDVVAAVVVVPRGL